MSKMSTAGLILIKDKKLLLALSKNKKAWYLPGGKVDVNESSVEAIQREVREELNLDIDPVRLKFLLSDYCSGIWRTTTPYDGTGLFFI